MSPVTGSQLSHRNKVGLVVAGVLGLTDLPPSPAALATMLFLWESQIEPVDLLVLVGFVAAAVLGLTTIVGVVLTWRRKSRIGARAVAAARVISALMTASVFLVQGQPAAMFMVAAALVILNIITVILVMSRPAAPPLPS
ncbi:hypothetical protein [Phytohabitans rumicis]|uniref:DUF2568 domain-containing protein n=1 Tax=Phytohabitans rumicis TaxID=1076125 RepID=A0A6V8LF90_9ACTN|nr:hypothetical protein [Phytohabitans rumicis]GFJ93501.1 hypothetical protein Prum_071430 [Phytohabitans rumicis]